MKRVSFSFLISALIASGAWLWLSWPTLAGLHTRWIDVGDSYVLGYPLIAAALWLLFEKRQSLRQMDAVPSWRGVILFAGAAAVIYAGRLIQLQIIQQIMLPLSLWFAVIALCGWHIGRAVLVPIALQYFGMPVWDPLIGVLRSVTVVVSETSLRWLQIPALIEGNHINLPGGIITIADACSGLNLLLATVLIATLQIQIGNYSVYRRALLLFMAAFMGLLDNWIRVVALVLIAHSSNMQNPLVYDHASFGWWIYAASMVPFFLIASRLEHPGIQSQAAMRTHRVLSTAVSIAPLAQAFVLILVVLCGALGANTLVSREGSAHAGLYVEGAERSIAPSFKPGYTGYDVEQSWLVSDATGTYELLALTYLRQSPSKKLIYYNNVIADEQHLQSTAIFVSPTGHSINVSIVHDTSAAGAQAWRVMWWYYWVDGAIVTSPQKAKLLQLRAALLGDPTAALIVLSSSCEEPGCAKEIGVAQQNTSDNSVFTKMLALHRAP